MSVSSPEWFEDIQYDTYINEYMKLPLPPHCPYTLILLSQNMVPGMFVAGGSCLTIIDKFHQFNDIDVYVNNKDAKQHVYHLLESWGFKKLPTANEEFIMDFSDDLTKVQLIYSDAIKDLQYLLSSFDFTVCKIGFDSVSVMAHTDCKSDYDQKMLRCNPVSKDAPRLLEHAFKYATKGFRMFPNLLNLIWENNTKNVLQIEAIPYQGLPYTITPPQPQSVCLTCGQTGVHFCAGNNYWYTTNHTK